MWLTGLSAGQEVLRWWLMVLLGLFGGGVLFSIYFYRLRDGGSVGPNKLSCFAMGWFYIGALPMLTRYPLWIIFFGAILGAVFQLIARVLKTGKRTERRFELPTLKRPYFSRQSLRSRDLQAAAGSHPGSRHLKGKTRDPGALSPAFWETIRLLDLLDSRYVLLYLSLNCYKLIF